IDPLVAFCDVHESVALPPCVMVEGLALSVQVGGGGGAALTTKVAVRVVLPWPLVVLVKVIVLGPTVPTGRLLALAFTVNVMVVGLAPTVPEVAEAVSQLGPPVIEKLTVPLVALSWYWNEDGVNGPPWVPALAMLVAGETTRLTKAALNALRPCVPAT